MTETVSFSREPADLPLEITTFVGRRSDRGRIRKLMSESPLVTLTGFGGIGKTRLALRMADELRRGFEDVYVVALSGIWDPDAVPNQIAAAMGIYPRTSGTISVIEYLRPRTVLLVLDNCEHVIEGAAVLVDTLLRTCPGVHILATSREPLRIDGELQYPVPPLTVPEREENWGPLHQYEGVRLFLDRAGAILPDFALTEDNRAAVAAISRKLEGIPLAIELAAARLRTLSPTQLDAQLTDRWDLLSRGSRNAPPRHSTMAACIEWSFDLCTPAEQLLWARASVFVDGFEFDAAAAVCSDVHDAEPLEETLASLVEKSVVTADQDPATNRYRMLPPIRQRGRAELARIGADADVVRRHKDYYLGLVARARDDWYGPRQVLWIGRLRRERGNVDKALEFWIAEPDSADECLRAGAHLLAFGLMEGRYEEGRRWFDRILAARSGDPGIRARALRTACLWAAIDGDIAAANAHLEEARGVASPLDSETQRLLTQAAGFVAMYAGNHAQAEQLLREANAGFAAAGNDAELAFSSALLALDYVLLGDLDRALEHNRTCLEITTRAGETWLRSWSLWIAALEFAARGDHAAAKDAATDSLRLKRLIAEPVGIAVVLQTLALLAADTAPERAATLLGSAQNAWDKIDTSTQIMPGLELPTREAVIAARGQLGDAAYESAWSRGRALDQVAAIALALEEQSPVSPKEAPSSRGEIPSTLTRRERQVADLVHRGLSNKQIADTLVISPRTAEAHVEHILTKLGFTSRTQVATWVADLLQAGDRNQSPRT